MATIIGFFPTASKLTNQSNASHMIISGIELSQIWIHLELFRPDGIQHRFTIDLDGTTQIIDIGSTSNCCPVQLKSPEAFAVCIEYLEPHVDGWG